jgi:hypothetical protein
MLSGIPTDPPNRRKIDPAEGMLLQCTDGPAAHLPQLG